MTELEQLEQELAYSAARSDIEIYCTPKKCPSCQCATKDVCIWFDLNSTEEFGGMVDPDSDQNDINKAARYLDLRGLLKRHPDNHHLVQILEPTGE